MSIPSPVVYQWRSWITTDGSTLLTEPMVPWVRGRPTTRTASQMIGRVPRPTQIRRPWQGDRQMGLGAERPDRWATCSTSPLPTQRPYAGENRRSGILRQRRAKAKCLEGGKRIESGTFKPGGNRRSVLDGPIGNISVPWPGFWNGRAI